MAGKARDTFAKRQKERARQDKQRDKIAKRQQRKSDRPDGAANLDSLIDWSARTEVDSSDPQAEDA